MSTPKEPKKPTPGAAPKASPAPAAKNGDKTAPEAPHPDPTRFGDWEKKGRCIDF